MLAATDLAVGIAAFFSVLSLTLYITVNFVSYTNATVHTGLQSAVIFTYVYSNVAIKISAFLNVVLGVVRTISIYKPFYMIYNRVLVVSLVLYALLFVLIVSSDVNLMKKYSIDEEWEEYVEALEEESAEEDRQE